MKSYRLIKLYPNSPELGTIIKSPFYEYNNGKQIINKIIFEDETQRIISKEFWEELKSYEIISFKHNRFEIDDSPIYILNKDGRYECDGISRSFNFLFFNKSYKIHSIKRLSDETIFMVGDKIMDLGNKDKIIEIQDDSMWLDGLKIMLTSSSTTLHTIQKI